ncbi:MAG: hypothetical protein RL293_1928 [Bacteroidota bacterium]|jgi:hypothetical protein
MKLKSELKRFGQTSIWMISKILWKENDRAIITFNSIQDIEKGRKDLAEIISEWISATR